MSNWFRGEREERYTTSNPVRALLPESKPSPEDHDADYPEHDEAALLLQATRVYELGWMPHIFPIIAAFLLTRIRKSELMGLQVDDAEFDRDQIRVQPNQHRRTQKPPLGAGGGDTSGPSSGRSCPTTCSAARRRLGTG